jgi:hypothetical protein
MSLHRDVDRWIVHKFKMVNGKSYNWMKVSLTDNNVADLAIAVFGIDPRVICKNPAKKPKPCKGGC